MSLRYLSVCSGIEAATVAWHPLGFVPVGFSEIDRFPSAVLAHHYPQVPNHGDFTSIGAPAIDLLVGGTPCQSFSVAGLRGGLADGRGNLALEFMRLAARCAPRWIVWENVPGVLSSNGGRDFGAILGALVELGYGFAYRVLDAQFFGVPQRRRRVFVVGHLGDWRRAAAVLFERESLRGDSAKGGEARKEASRSVARRAGNGRDAVPDQADEAVGDGVREVAGTLGGGSGNRGWAPDTDRMTFVPVPAFNNTGQGWWNEAKTAATVRSGDKRGGGGAREATVAIHATNASNIAHCLASHAAKGGDPTTDNYVLAPIAFDTTQITSKTNRSQPAPGRPCHPLAAQAHPPAIALAETVGPLTADAGPNSHGRSGVNNQAVASGHVLPTRALQVRRLTPRECERLQGFPDDYTLIPVGKKSAADGPRYKALGNSMAVPVMRWIGARIARAEAAQ